MVFNKYNNNMPSSSFTYNLIYLIVSRPLYIIGFSMMVLPMLLKNKSFAPLSDLLAHKYWIPYSKLTYGVFLSNSIWMQFRVFNLQHGDWIQSFDLMLFFGAFLTLSFLFSFFTYLFVEAPMSNLL